MQHAFEVSSKRLSFVDTELEETIQRRRLEGMSWVRTESVLHAFRTESWSILCIRSESDATLCCIDATQGPGHIDVGHASQ